jgi:SAM-dependent methyltransferase
VSLIGEQFCYHVSHLLLSRSRLGRYQELARVSENEDDFEQWRAASVEKSLTHFPPVSLNGRTVLDFGCGTGELAFRLKEMGAAKVFGVDLNADCLDRARAANPYGAAVEFLLGGESSIPLPAGSVDCVFCVAVLEHVIHVDSILKEWSRILRPGGQVLIDWSAWHHPDGSHLDSVIPIPYAQCIFSERTLARTAARVRLSNVYEPKFWDSTETTTSGDIPPLQDQYTQNFLNKMSIEGFNRKLKKSGLFQVAHYECHPPNWAPYVRPLLRIAFCREHLTSFVTYILTNPKNGSN